MYIASKYLKQKLTELHGEMNKFTYLFTYNFSSY